MKDNIKEFLNYLEIEKRFSPNTVSAYHNDLLQLVQFVQQQSSPEGPITGWSEVDRPLLLKYILYLRDPSKKYAAATIARKIASTKSLFDFLTAEDLVKSNPTESLGGPKVGKPLPRPISIHEVHQLLEQPAKLSTPEAKRDRAMLQLLYATGMRVSEMASLNIADVNPEAGYVRCLGKGSKERVIPMHQQAAQALKDYLDQARPKLVQNSQERALFLNFRGDRLTRQGFWQILKGYAKQANLGIKVTPHTLRHSFATHMLGGGADLRSVQELLGHANISTTQVYTQLSSEHLHHVYDKSHPRASKE